MQCTNLDQFENIVLEREFNRNFFLIKVLLSTDRFEKCGLEKLIEDELYLIYADP